MFDDIGWPEALIILAIVLIIFGAGKLPEIGGALGKSIREFRRAKDGLDEEEEEKTKSKPKRKRSAVQEIGESVTKANQS
jgi:sec-independent protein translocase protein TatA